MGDINFKIKCSRCGGTGIDNNARDENGNPIPQSCVTCGGDGWIEISKIDVTDIMDAIADVLKKCKDIETVVEYIKKKIDK